MTLKQVILLSPFYLIIGGMIFFHVSLKIPANVGIIDEKTLQNSQSVINPGTPKEIIMPSINTALQINAGNYTPEKDSWNISDHAAFFAQESAPLMSEKGNTIIYAHNKDILFGNINKLGPGDVITIKDDNNISHNFEYLSKIEVSPRDPSVFYELEDYKLVLLTCSGLLDQNRLLVFFKPTIKE